MRLKLQKENVDGSQEPLMVIFWQYACSHLNTLHTHKYNELCCHCDDSRKLGTFDIFLRGPVLDF